MNIIGANVPIIMSLIVVRTKVHQRDILQASFDSRISVIIGQITLLSWKLFKDLESSECAVFLYAFF